jgi:hypothetical protein
MVLVLGCPVLTANQVTFWNALRAAGARPPITHYGQIFSEPLPADRVGCFNRRMAAQGQKRTLGHVRAMSALPPKADIGRTSGHVRFVPKADILRCGKEGHYSIISSARASGFL